MGRTEMNAVRFARGSNVREYWLANAEGFEVVPRTILRKRVESVVVGSALGQAKALIIRSSFRRRERVLRAELVTAVDPFARVLYLAHKQQQQQQREMSGARVASAVVAGGARARRRPRRRPPHAEARQARRRYAVRWERSRRATAAGRSLRSRLRNNTF